MQPGFTASDNFAQILENQKVTLTISTYDARQVILLSGNENRLTVERTGFRSPMGIAVKEDHLAIATKDEVILYRADRDFAGNFPQAPGVHDAVYMPRAVYFSGEVDLHDLHFADSGLLAVNTQFSCLAEIGPEWSWKPVWQPPFVTEIAPGDRCHLNAVAMEAEKPVWATALGATDAPGAWKSGIRDSGVLISVPENKVTLSGLAMPHSPRLLGGELWMLLSASGELIRVNASGTDYEMVCRLPAFVRGLSGIGDFLFVGTSAIRPGKSNLQHHYISPEDSGAGIYIVEKSSGQAVAWLKFEAPIHELYDVVVLPDIQRPRILPIHTNLHKKALSIPGKTYWQA